MKTANIILIVVLAIIVVAVAGYFGAGYYLKTQLSPEYLFVHPTIAKIFNVTPTCPLVCPQGGVCGKDGKDYCNICLAFRMGAGYAHDGHCFTVYKNDKYGFQINIPNSWKGFWVEIGKWNGQQISGNKKYTGVLLTIKNPQTTASQVYQDIPIMVFTPDVWAMVSGPNATVAVSAAPIGPEKVGENSKYVFATPPRWWGFTNDLGGQEASNIVTTFKAFEIK